MPTRPNIVSTSSLKTRLLNLSQTSVYTVSLNPPNEVNRFLNNSGLSYATDGRDLELLASETTLPGSTFATHDRTSDFVGVTEKMAYRRIYDETIDMTFYVDKEYKIIEFFDGWMDYISGVGRTGTKEQYKNQAATYRLSYPKYYKTNISVTKFEKDLRDKAMTYTFVGAFPISINNIPLSYNTSDITRFSVSFSYIRYTRERHNTTQSVNSFPLGDVSRGDIVGVVNIGNGLFRIERLLNGQIITEVSSSRPTL